MSDMNMGSINLEEVKKLIKKPKAQRKRSTRYLTFPHRASWYKKACRGKFQFAKGFGRAKQDRLKEYREAQKQLAKKDRKAISMREIVKQLMRPFVRTMG